MTKVLCVVRYWYRQRNSTRSNERTVMIDVMYPDTEVIENIFYRKMHWLLTRWNEHWGDRPNAFSLIAYLTESGVYHRIESAEVRVR